MLLSMPHILQRMRFRFSLLTLLAVVTLLCAGMGWLASRYHAAQRQIGQVEAFCRYGGKAHRTWRDSDFNRRHAPATLRAAFTTYDIDATIVGDSKYYPPDLPGEGIDLLDRQWELVTQMAGEVHLTISCAAGYKPRHAAHFARMGSVELLVLVAPSSQQLDEIAVQLPQMPRLRSLIVRSEELSFTGFIGPKRIKITRELLQQLGSCSELRVITLANADFSEEAVAELETNRSLTAKCFWLWDYGPIEEPRRSRLEACENVFISDNEAPPGDFF